MSFHFVNFLILPNVLSLLNLIKFTKHLSTLLFAFPFKYVYLKRRWKASQNMLVLIPSPLYNNKPISLYMVPSTYRNNLHNNLLPQNYEVFHKEHLNSYRIIFHLFVPELSVTACEPLPQLEIFLFLISIVFWMLYLRAMYNVAG